MDTAMPLPLPVVVDIRPGLCPNHLRIESPLTIPVAVLGTVDLDITNIDPATVRLSRSGVAGECIPVGYAYADVGIPVIGSVPDCSNPPGDGLDDLRLDFSIRDIAARLGLRDHVGETVPLTLSARLITGQAIEGGDRAVVLAGRWEDEGLGGDVGDEIGMLAPSEDESARGEVEFDYYTNTCDRITLTVYDVRGRLVANLINMEMAPGIYRTTWDGEAGSAEKAPAGTYFARLSNSMIGCTRRFTLLQ